MSYFVTCTHEQRILNGTSSDTSLCHWGYLEKKIFPDVPDLPDVARSGQIWPDLGRLGKFFFSKKKKNFQIWPDLGGPDLEIWPDLAASVYSDCRQLFFKKGGSLSPTPLFKQKNNKVDTNFFIPPLFSTLPPPPPPPVLFQCECFLRSDSPFPVSPPPFLPLFLVQKKYQMDDWRLYLV